MPILCIRDREDGVLLDLVQVLDALGPDFSGCDWIIRDPENDDPFQAVGSGGIELEKLSRQSASISDAELRRLLQTTTQIIWGGFVPLMKNVNTGFPLRIEIIDGSHYELTSDDELLINRLSKQFSDTKRIG